MSTAIGARSAASSLVTRSATAKVPVPEKAKANAVVAPTPAFVVSSKGAPEVSANYGPGGAGARPAPSSANQASALKPASVDPQSDGHLYATGDGPITVDIMNSDSGYENQIYWSSDNWATRHLVGTDNQVGSVTLGTFAKGTQIDFGIVNGVGQFMSAGGAAANFDNVDHVRSQSVGDGVQLGFEDLAGGGDLDFNDAIIHVHGATVQPPASNVTPDAVTPPAATHSPEPAKGTAPPKSAEPAKPATPAIPATPAKPAEPAKSAMPAIPATPAKPAEPAKSATPAIPATPAKPAEPAKSATPAIPAKPAEPAKSATPAIPATPATPAIPAKPSTPAVAAKSAEPAKPAQPATPAIQAKPAQPATTAAVTKALVTYLLPTPSANGNSHSVKV